MACCTWLINIPGIPVEVPQITPRFTISHIRISRASLLPGIVHHIQQLSSTHPWKINYKAYIFIWQSLWTGPFAFSFLENLFFLRAFPPTSHTTKKSFLLFRRGMILPGMSLNTTTASFWSSVLFLSAQFCPKIVHLNQFWRTQDRFFSNHFFDLKLSEFSRALNALNCMPKKI